MSKIGKDKKHEYKINYVLNWKKDNLKKKNSNN